MSLAVIMSLFVKITRLKTPLFPSLLHTHTEVYVLLLCVKFVCLVICANYVIWMCDIFLKCSLFFENKKVFSGIPIIVIVIHKSCECYKKRSDVKSSIVTIYRYFLFCV